LAGGDGGAAQQRRWVGTMAREEGDADAGAGIDRELGEFDRLAQQL
jgi:hypothetical protein